ncbi:MAG: CDP-glycerol glycerophosphotransferase family protein [bacterium]|nr:CDP-glycerol glycerophosphotransferase family protein [bacterium]
MKMLFIKFGILYFKFIWLFFKPLRVKNRVTFISRQSNIKSQDIVLLERGLKQKGIETVALCKKLEFNICSELKYFFHMFVQMYYLATSKVIVLDGYCILACLLKKKKNTIIIQMWHAMGAFKKFGYSVIGQGEGASIELSKVMKMHNNYDYIFTSSKYTKKYFSEAFNADIEKLVVMPLPRVDLLTSSTYKASIRKKIYKKYPKLNKKKNIVYAPTFRKNEESLSCIQELINCIDYTKYNLVIKLHPLSNLNIIDNRVIIDKNFSTADMMMIADYIITDYSAIVFEAAILNKPIYFYCYDYKEYYNKRNFYLDYKRDMPGIISENPKKIIESINKNIFDERKLYEFKRKYIEIESGKSTFNIVNFILNRLK